jgi:hypothetical protein
MYELSRNRQSGFDLARKGKLVVATVLFGVLLGGCGGGGGDGGGGASAAPAAQTSSGGSALTAVPSAAKGSTTLSWVPPTTYDDGTPLKITGYRIYWGLSEGHYPNSVTLNNPGLTRFVVEQLEPSKWYFVATALSADGESPPSNVVVMNVL